MENGRNSIDIYIWPQNACGAQSIQDIKYGLSGANKGQTWASSSWGWGWRQPLLCSALRRGKGGGVVQCRAKLHWPQRKWAEEVEARSPFGLRSLSLREELRTKSAVLSSLQHHGRKRSNFVWELQLSANKMVNTDFTKHRSCRVLQNQSLM